MSDPSREEKLAALEQALGSPVMSRSSQISSMLRHLCELEINGRGEEITECLIAREILGRPADYNPVDDATVRNRAHTLRRKLEEIYASDLANAPVRIELPKGLYRPRFVRAQTDNGLQDTVEVTPSRKTWRLLAFGFLFGLLAATLILLSYVWLGSRDVASSNQDPIFREVWGPLVAPGAETLVVLGTPLQMFVRPYPPGQSFDHASGVLDLLPERDARIYNAFKRRHPLATGQRLYANLTHNSPLWGDGVGALLMIQVLLKAGASYELWPERAGSPILMRGRNVVLFGREEYSETARLVSRNQNFYIDYAPERHNLAVFNRKPKKGEPALYASDPPSYFRETYGLITVMPSPGTPEQNCRTIMISGLTSAGIQAAAEFFSSPRMLHELQDRFRKEGYSRTPRHYQVVVQTGSIDTMPRAWRYQTHRVLAR